MNTAVMAAFLSTDQAVFSSSSCDVLYVTVMLFIANMGAINNNKWDLMKNKCIFINVRHIKDKTCSEVLSSLRLKMCHTSHLLPHTSSWDGA